MAPRPIDAKAVERCASIVGAKHKGDQQALVNGLALTFFAIARIFGIPRDEVEQYLPDNIA